MNKDSVEGRRWMFYWRNFGEGALAPARGDGSVRQ